MHSQIDDRSIRYAGICDDFYEIPRALDRARNAFSKAGGQHTFCPDPWPTIVTLFGNNLGNEIHREGDFFSSMREALASPGRARPVWLALGVSTDAREEEEYKGDEMALLLQNIVHLRDVRGILKTDEGKDEFGREAQCIVEPHEYLSAQAWGLHGRFYRFVYKLRGDIELEIGNTWETLPAKTRLTVCHIVKFNVESLNNAMKNLGFTVEGVSSLPVAPSNRQERSYAVLSASISC